MITDTYDGFSGVLWSTRVFTSLAGNIIIKKMNIHSKSQACQIKAQKQKLV